MKLIATLSALLFTTVVLITGGIWLTTQLLTKAAQIASLGSMGV